MINIFYVFSAVQGWAPFHLQIYLRGNMIRHDFSRRFMSSPWQIPVSKRFNSNVNKSTILDTLFNVQATKNQSDEQNKLPPTEMKIIITSKNSRYIFN